MVGDTVVALIWELVEVSLGHSGWSLVVPGVGGRVRRPAAYLPVSRVAPA